MKKCLFFMLMVFSLNVIAQEKPIQCDSVIQAKDKTAEQIYTTVKAWLATSFNSANDVIQMDDSDNGIIICKGAFEYKAPGGLSYRYIDGWVNYTLKIQIREGRFKISMGNFIHESSNLEYKKTWSFGLITDRDKFKPSGMQDKRWLKTWPDLKVCCKKEFFLIVMSLSDATSKQSDILDTDDDW